LGGRQALTREICYRIIELAQHERDIHPARSEAASRSPRKVPLDQRLSLLSRKGATALVLQRFTEGGQLLLELAIGDRQLLPGLTRIRRAERHLVELAAVEHRPQRLGHLPAKVEDAAAGILP